MSLRHTLNALQKLHASGKRCKEVCSIERVCTPDSHHIQGQQLLTYHYSKLSLPDSCDSPPPAALLSDFSPLHQCTRQQHHQWFVRRYRCRYMSKKVCVWIVVQASPVGWHQLLFAADALQELCWEKLHTGHWMDVHVVSIPPTWSASCGAGHRMCMMRSL